MKHLLKKIIIMVLTLEARLILHKYKPKIVGITGSVGKTSTKDAIAAVLSGKFIVRKSQKSFNSEFGLPLTILGCDTAWNNPIGWLKNILKGLWVIVVPHAYPQWLVLEMGVDHPGDMKKMASWVTLDIAVITHIGNLPVHVEFFPSIESLVEEKAKILSALKSKGLAILTYDDENVLELKGKTKSRVCTFGLNEEADIHAGYYNIMYGGNDLPTGINFKVLFNGNVAPVTLQGILGKQFIYPILAAFAVGMSQGLQIVEMTDAIDSLVTSPGRMRVLEGSKESIVIDDTYNSSPIAVVEALDALKTITSQGRKIAVLGDMAELGAYSSEAHTNIGKMCSGIIDILLTVGSLSRDTAEAAMAHGVKAVRTFDNSTEAGEYLSKILQKNDIALVKGSQRVRMEKVVEKIMAHPEHKQNLLVRQDEAWGKK